MALYQNGILISGANKLPQMTYAEWQALPAVERPSEWICTDRSYSDLPASDVTYDNTDSGLSADNIQDAIDEVAQSGGSGGHVIQDASGTAVAQEPTMQFTDSHVSDDSANEKTVIENIKSVSEAQFESATEDGLYLLPDGDGSVIEPASEDYVEVTGDGVKTVSTLLNELYALIDRTKIGENTQLVQISGNDITCFEFARIRSDRINFYSIDQADTTTLYTTEYSVRATNSTGYNWNIGVNGTSSVSNLASVILPSGVKYILYYGNKKAVVDLQTTANRCWYDSNNTVKQKLDGLFKQTTMTPDISVPSQGYNFCAYDTPSGYKLISVNMGLNGLSIFSQISKFGDVDRIAFFNTYTQAITLNHAITLTFVKI